MSKSFKQRMVRWLWKLLDHFLNGLATGFVTATGIEGIDKVVPGAIHSVTPRQFVMICLVSGVASAINYYRSPDGRLPSIDTEDGDTPVPPLP